VPSLRDPVPFYELYPRLASGAALCRPFGAGVGWFGLRLLLRKRRREVHFSVGSGRGYEVKTPWPYAVGEIIGMLRLRGEIASRSHRSAQHDNRKLVRREFDGWCRPFGTRFPFIGLTPDLRPGLHLCRPFGAGVGWVGLVSFPAAASQLYFSAESGRACKIKVPTSAVRDCRDASTAPGGPSVLPAALSMTRMACVMLSGVGRGAERASLRSRSIPAFGRLHPRVPF
jgi:hypothetical protein